MRATGRFRVIVLAGALLAVGSSPATAADPAGLIAGTVAVAEDLVDSTEPLISPVPGETVGEVVDRPVDVVTPVLDTTETLDPVLGTATESLDPLLEDPANPLPPPSEPAREPVVDRRPGPEGAMPTTVPTPEAPAAGSGPAGITPEVAGDPPHVTSESSNPSAAPDRRNGRATGVTLADLRTPSPVHPTPVVTPPGHGELVVDRVLSWFDAHGVGLLGIIGGPLLALEILVRALLSAGSGLVAPAALLAAYLVHLLGERRLRLPWPKRWPSARVPLA